MTHLVTIDHKVGDEVLTYTYDADMKIATADDGLAFLISQLAVVEAKIYETKYRKIVFQEFVPVDTSDPEYVDNVDYISYDAVTVGKFVGANAKDLPQSDLNAAKSSIKVFYGGNSYSYSLDELRKSQAMRIPVDVTKARMSYRGFQEHAQRVAFFGDADRGVTGLFNNANVQLDTSGTDWGTASGQEIIADMNGLLIKVWQNSAETHVPNVLILPSDQWAIISNKRMDTGTDTTVLQFFMMNNLYKDLTGAEITVKPNFELKTAGVADAPRMMAYELNDENLTMRMPLPWRALAPQPFGLQVDVPAEYKFGGVEFRYPGSAAYRDFLIP
jgi:hypothetical protein